MSLCSSRPSILTSWSSRSPGHVALDCHFLVETAHAFASQGARLGPPPKASYAETVTILGLQLGWTLLAGARLRCCSHTRPRRKLGSRLRSHDLEIGAPIDGS